MRDMEKAIKAIEICYTVGHNCTECPYNSEDDCNDELMQDVLAMLREQKPVVFCRDCKYWNAGTCSNDNVSRQIEDCGCYPDFVTDSNWFCAEGERR